MTPYPQFGVSYPGEVLLKGSFLINGTSDPDGIRDGNTNMISSVVRNSAGLFTVTFADFARNLLCDQPVTENAWLNPNDATPTLVCACGVVDGSYNRTTRSFQILTTKVADVGAAAYFDPAPADPDDNSRVCFEISGSILPIGKD